MSSITATWEQLCTMLDTIRLKIYLADPRPFDPEKWEVTHRPKVVETAGEPAEVVDHTAQHRFSGLRLMGRGGYTRLEVSLPRLHFGHNGKLIRNQADLDSAWSSLFGLMADVSGGPIGIDTWIPGEVTRADLVWSFPGDPATWVLAHRQVKHPTVRRRARGAEYFGPDLSQGLTWTGRNHMFRIYDKQLEQTNEPGGQVVRAELEMRQAFLNRRLGDSPSHLVNFSDLYSAYRKFCIRFDPHTVTPLHGASEILAFCERNNFSHHGQSVFELWALGKSRWTIARMRNRLRQVQLPSHGIDWGSLLPPAGPATYAEVEDVQAVSV